MLEHFHVRFILYDPLYSLCVTSICTHIIILSDVSRGLIILAMRSYSLPIHYHYVYDAMTLSSVLTNFHIKFHSLFFIIHEPCFLINLLIFCHFHFHHRPKKKFSFLSFPFHSLHSWKIFFICFVRVC